MYKVFVNDKPIILTDSLKSENNFPVYIFKDVVIDEIIYKLRKDRYRGVNLYAPNIEDSWREFKKSFKVIEAAGGLVLNNEEEILFIYRANKWDLPKGRIEKGESIETTALREVEEECGITGLIIEKPLIVAYHIFYQNNKNRLKTTHWFLMSSNYKGTLTPQLEEGITKAVFKNENDTMVALQKTYANINVVYTAYKKGL